MLIVFLTRREREKSSSSYKKAKPLDSRRILSLYAHRRLFSHARLPADLGTVDKHPDRQNKEFDRSLPRSSVSHCATVHLSHSLCAPPPHWHSSCLHVQYEVPIAYGQHLQGEHPTIPSCPRRCMPGGAWTHGFRRWARLIQEVPRHWPSRHFHCLRSLEHEIKFNLFLQNINFLSLHAAGQWRLFATTVPVPLLQLPRPSSPPRRDHHQSQHAQAPGPPHPLPPLPPMHRPSLPCLRRRPLRWCCTMLELLHRLSKRASRPVSHFFVPHTVLFKHLL